MSKPIKPIIIPNHHNHNTTVVYKGYILNGTHFFSKRNAEKMFKSMCFSAKHKKDILTALEGKLPDAKVTSDDKAFLLFAEKYCVSSSVPKMPDTHIERVIIKYRDTYSALQYCANISNSAAMRRVILESKDPMDACSYCTSVSIDPDMREKVLKGGAEYAFYFCKYASEDDDMRQVVLNTNSPHWAWRYCYEVSNDADMRQIILDAKDPDYAYSYCHFIANDADMRQIIVDAGEPHWALEYCRDVSNDEDMRAVVINSGAKELIKELEQITKPKKIM